jgi:hypothetical protein
MKTQARLFWILCGFFVAADIAYTVWSIANRSTGAVTQLAGTQAGAHAGSAIEWTGTLGIGLTAVLSAFLAFYLGRTSASFGGVLPEDRPDANIDDGDPEQGFFSPWSWWPLILAAGCALLFLGVAVGFWIAYIGVAVTGIAIVGWVYEYYRGNFAR